jgi:uncharacterized damage-inducible protein DinB
MARPDRSEAASYYFGYIDLVPAGDICTVLETQLRETLAMLDGIPEEQSAHRYAPDKWSIRQVVAHLTDCERLFLFRAFWFARGFQTPLPSFDQHVAMAAAAADQRPWRSHLEDFRAARQATVSFYRGLPPEAWSGRGIASDNPFTVRALAYLAAGHVIHHLALVRTRYLRQ